MSPASRSLILLGGLTVTLALSGCRSTSSKVAGDTPARAQATTTTTLPIPRLLVFSRTTGYRHTSIPTAVAAVRDLAAQLGASVDATEDPTAFNDANLAHYRAVAFLLTTGDVLDDTQQAAFERFMKGGHGFLGVHSATDTEYDWPFYASVVGAQFKHHPASQPATVKVDDPANPSTSGLPARWTWTDEWYDFRANPRSAVHVLLSVDESTYTGGGMGADHPIAWCHAVGRGRAWYTALGHAEAAYADPTFRGHLKGGIADALGLGSACAPNG